VGIEETGIAVMLILKLLWLWILIRKKLKWIWQ